MKKKIFPKIIYYLFTFSLGILLAFTLPYIMMLYCAPIDIENYLAEGDYGEAAKLTSGYFYQQTSLVETFDDGSGVVLFPAATLVDEKEDKLHKSYSGFLFGVMDSYKVKGEDNNQTKLIVTDKLGAAHKVDLLDYKINKEGKKETQGFIGTLASNGFVYLDIGEEIVGSLSKLTFVDKDGEVFREIKLSQVLDYSEEFFDDVTPFLEEYNRDYRSDKLEDLHKVFLAKNDNYIISTYETTQKHADTKAAVIIVVYFVVIYIIGDFLVGRHYILRFCKWLHFKTPWGKRQALRRPPKESFGHDYFSQVTMSLDLSEVPDFSESVQVRYTLGDVGVCFLLMKENNYVVTQRTKAGVYVNAWMDINKDYAPIDMPENLVVEGYKMDVKIKIIKRKEESV